MSSSRRAALTTFYFAFMMLQICQLIPALQLGWPFSPYTLFRFFGSRDAPHMSVALLEDDGSVQDARSGNIFPVEFFSAYDMVRSIFIAGHAKPLQDAVAQLALNRLNTEPWRHIQGIYPPARPIHGSRFVGLSVCRVTYDYESVTDAASPAILTSQCPYSYRMPGK